MLGAPNAASAVPLTTSVLQCVTCAEVVKVASGVGCGGVECVGSRGLVSVYPHNHGGCHTRSSLE